MKITIHNLMNVKNIENRKTIGSSFGLNKNEIQNTSFIGPQCACAFKG